jgi:dynein heavy chain
MLSTCPSPFQCTKVTELSEQLKAALVEAEYINGQEKMFGWAMTKYGNVTKVSRTVRSVPG